jgi:hypothetical protein
VANLLSTFLTASQAAYIAFRRVFEDPANAHGQGSQQSQISNYNLLWAYYSGAMFDRGVAGFASWAAYKKNYALYRQIRLVYNPTKRLVDFYASQIYPGVLSEDGSQLPDGVQLAIPFAKDTPDELKAAIAQFWQWSNWQSLKGVHVRYAAALGNVLIEICDDVEKGKIAAEVVWPGHVVELELDHQGNVKRYVLEYQAQEDALPGQKGITNQTLRYYTYRKEVDSESFRTYKNGQPFGYDGKQPIEPNIYGFVPAVWVKHTDVGGDQGSPAIAGSLAKIDELNSLASHVHDQVHKVIGAPILISSGSGGIANLFQQQTKKPNTEELTNPESDRESVLMLKGPADAKVHSLAGELSLGDAAMYMDKLIAEIEQDHPELSMYRELRQMSQVTGPAAARLVGDVASRVYDAAANYDQQSIKLFQMAVAIAGFRANGNGWQNLTRQQAKFKMFNLDSYERGDLDFAIMPRPIMQPTKTEMAQEKTAYWTGIQVEVAAGVPIEVALEEDGWDEERLAKLRDAKDEAVKRQQELFASQQPPSQPQNDNNQQQPAQQDKTAQPNQPNSNKRAK